MIERLERMRTIAASLWALNVGMNIAFLLDGGWSFGHAIFLAVSFLGWLSAARPMQ